MASVRRLMGFIAMTSVVLVVAHNLVFLLAYGVGFDEALAHSGHDGTWATAVGVVLATALALCGLASWRLFRLGLRARNLAPTEGGLDPGPRRFVRGLAGLWLRLAGATAVLFVIQENLERQHVGESLPGLSVLGSAEYPGAALVIGAVALAIAFVVALFRWQRDGLVARIAATRAPWARAARTIALHGAPWAERRHASTVVGQFSGRAPPQRGNL